jgi:glycosyltransferase involved in cell wall biosynthesis
MTRESMTPPSVSIVVMNHNYGRYVGEALASAIGQEPGNYRLAEVVVIDVGSTDHSHEVYGRFTGVRVVRKAHEGFAATLTCAVREASGDWLAPLDADDAFTPDKLRTLAPHLADPARLLMAADFIALGQDYDALMVVLGIDEHRYVRFAQEARSRMDGNIPLRAGFTLSAAYTRMNRGFGGHPKFSKSIPGSAIDVTTTSEDLHRLLAEEAPVPEESVAYQLMCQMPRYDADTLLDLHAHCREAGPTWQRAVRGFADYVIGLISLWPC